MPGTVGRASLAHRDALKDKSTSALPAKTVKAEGFAKFGGGLWNLKQRPAEKPQNKNKYSLNDTMVTSFAQSLRRSATDQVFGVYTDSCAFSSNPTYWYYRLLYFEVYINTGVQQTVVLYY